jgi:hypothetical protein
MKAAMHKLANVVNVLYCGVLWYVSCWLQTARAEKAVRKHSSRFVGTTPTSTLLMFMFWNLSNGPVI